MSSIEFSDVSGQVSYHEVNAMIRLGQRTELEAYFRQFLTDLETISRSDIRLAKSRLISLVTVIVNSILEIGALSEVEERIYEVAEKCVRIETHEEFQELAKHCLSHMIVCAKPNANRISIQIVENAKQIVQTRYSENLTVEKVAAELFMSRSHFRFLFKEATGIPFKRYLTEMRLNVARTLFETSRISVKEVCARVGYLDTSSFYRAYRAYHGVAPITHKLASL